MNMTEVRTGDYTAVLVFVVLGRRFLSNFLTIYLPTLLLNIIGHTTVYFKAFFFEAIISVNLTVMLVLTTMFISVSGSLPKTSYIKMVDIWLIFNLVVPFVEVLLQTYIEYLRGKVVTVSEVGEGQAVGITPLETDHGLGTQQYDQ